MAANYRDGAEIDYSDNEEPQEHETMPTKCPRCGGWIPNDDEPGAYCGAMSRVSSSLGVYVELCSNCGMHEAFADPLGKKGFAGWHTVPTTLIPLDVR